MKHSALHARIIAVVIATVILTALLTTRFFGMVSSSTFSRIKEEELRPRADAMARLVAKYGSRLDGELLRSMIDIEREDESLIGVYGMIMDAKGNVLVKSDVLADELLSSFGSIKAIKNATYDELLEVDGMNSKAAESVLEYFAKSEK